MLYGSEAWPVVEEDLIKLKRNDARMCYQRIGFLQRNLGLN